MSFCDNEGLTLNALSDTPQNGRTSTRKRCTRTREKSANEWGESSARLPAVLELTALKNITAP